MLWAKVFDSIGDKKRQTMRYVIGFLVVFSFLSCKKSELPKVDSFLDAALAEKSNIKDAGIDRTNIFDSLSQGKEEKQEKDEHHVVKSKTSPKVELVGVRECDEYLKKHTKCILRKMPPAVRAMALKNLDLMRQTWRTSAQTDIGREGLVKACKAVMDASQKAMGQYRCRY